MNRYSRADPVSWERITIGVLARASCGSAEVETGNQETNRTQAKNCGRGQKVKITSRANLALNERVRGVFLLADCR